MKNWYNKYNKKQDFFDIIKYTFGAKTSNLPSGNLKVEVKNYVFGRQFIGTGLIVIDFIFFLLLSKIYMPILNIFFAKKVKTESFDTTGHKTIKTNFVNKLKYKKYGIFNKYAINVNNKTQKKLNKCDHRITEITTGEVYINFCKTINLEHLDKKKIHIITKQSHSYMDIIPNYINHNMIKMQCDYLFRCSHIAVIYFDTTKNDWFMYDKQGNTQKTLFGAKIVNNWNIGSLNNPIDFNGNYFVIPLNINIAGDTAIRRYFEATQVDNSKIGQKSVSNAQVLMHNLSKMIRTVIYPITKNMPFFQQKIRHFTNKYFTPRLANLVAKRDVPFSGACLELIIEIIYNMIQDRHNKQFVKNFGESEEFCEYFLKYIIDYNTDGSPIFCKTHFVDFILFLTHFTENGNGRFVDNWKVVV